MSQELFTPVVVPAVQMYNGRPATTSRDVARYFGKNHAHVMRDIKEIIDNQPELLGRSKHGSAYGEKTEGNSFELASYIDEQGKSRPMYILYQDGFILLVMGYKGKEASRIKMAYIKAFNAMKAQLTAGKTAPALPEAIPAVRDSRYQFGEYPIRAALDDAGAWFVARDICAALGINFSGHLTLAGLPENWKRLSRLTTRKGPQPIWLISAAGVHRLAASVHAPIADALIDWLETVVMPDMTEARNTISPLPMHRMPSIEELQAFWLQVKAGHQRIRSIAMPLLEQLRQLETPIFDAMQQALFGGTQSSRCVDGRPLSMQWSQGEALFRALDPKQEAISAWNDPAQNLIQYVRSFMERA